MKAPTVVPAHPMPAPAAVRRPDLVADRSLLEPPVDPDCAFKGPVSNPITPQETRMTLDYEQQCYRQAEVIVRTRLQQLQKALDDPSVVQSQPEPDCAFRGSLSNPATAEEMHMKLEYEKECYRQAESIVRARLRQLQNSVRRK